LAGLPFGSPDWAEYLRFARVPQDGQREPPTGRDTMLSVSAPERGEPGVIYSDSNIRVVFVELLVPTEATRSYFYRISDIEYPSQCCFGARRAYSLW